MAYKNTFKDVLKISKNRRKKRDFELSKAVKRKKGKTIKNLSYISISEIHDYITDNYTNEKTVFKENLIKDLVAFKSYKEYLEINTKEESFFFSFIGQFISIYSALLAISITNNKLIEKFSISIFPISINFGGIGKTGLSENTVTILFMLFVIAIFLLIFVFINTGKKSDNNRLRTVNNAIFILEALKEEIYNNPKCRIEDEKDEDQEIEIEDSIEITKPENISDTGNDNAIENEIIKVEIIDHSNKFDINFIKGASCMAVLLLSIAKLFGKKKKD